MKHGLGQISGSFSRGVESLKRSAQSRGGSTPVYCKGVRQLDNYGYEKFNLEDGGEEIFISRHSERSMFNEDDSILIRATDGNFVTQPDTTKEVRPAEDPVVEIGDARRLFGNVPVSDTPCEFHGVVGTVDDGRVVPMPVDAGFLDKMVNPVSDMQKLDMDKPAYREVTIPEVPVEDAPVDSGFMAGTIVVTSAIEEPEIIEETVETPAEEVFAVSAEEIPEEVPETVETPAEEPVEEVPVAPVESREFFVGTEEEIVGASVDEVPEEPAFDSNSLDDDYEMMFPDQEESEAVVGVAGAIAVAGALGAADAPVEEPVEEIPVAPVGIPEEVPETVEAHVEEPVVVEPKVGRTVEVPEMPEGLYIEGNEPGNAAVATAGAAVLVAEATVTGGTVAEPPTGIRVGLDADGEALPPISDPVVTRPRSVRFRFANGVLMSVDPKTEGSQEGPSRPLE